MAAQRERSGWEKIPKGGAVRYPVARYEARGAGRRRTLELRDSGSVESPYPRLAGSSQAASLLRECLRDAEQRGREELWLVFLEPCSSGFEPVGVIQLEVGSEESVVVDIPKLLRLVLLSGRESFLIAHNHPSGDPKPSMGDWNITSQLVEAAGLLELEFVDHLIVAGDCYASLAEMCPSLFDVEELQRP
jgi:DNA repair protein RadC